MKNLQAHPPVTQRTARWTWTVDYDQQSGPVPDMRGRSAGDKPVTFRPGGVTVAHHVPDNAPPTVSILVTGRRVKVDGTCSFNTASAVFTPGDEMPGWLRELVEGEMSKIITILDVTGGQA